MKKATSKKHTNIQLRKVANSRPKADERVTKIVQIKGSNGSGKTTIVKTLGALSKEWTYLEDGQGHVMATIFDDICWAAIGKYDPDKPMGGCDLMHGIDEIKTAILTVLENYPGYWIVFEGMMISTIKSTFYDFLLQLKQERGIEPLFVILKSTLDGCVSRLEKRGTKKDGLSLHGVADKCEKVVRHAREAYDPRLVRWINVETTPQDAMMPVFLWEVDDSQLIDSIYNMASF